MVVEVMEVLVVVFWWWWRWWRRWRWCRWCMLSAWWRRWGRPRRVRYREWSTARRHNEKREKGGGGLVRLCQVVTDRNAVNGNIQSVKIGYDSLCCSHDGRGC